MQLCLAASCRGLSQPKLLCERLNAHSCSRAQRDCGIAQGGAISGHSSDCRPQIMSSRARYCSLWGTDRDRCRVPQSRVGHSRTISYFKRAVRRRATPSGSETQSRFALPTQPTQLGHCPTAPYLSVSFLQPLGCAAVISWQRHLAGQNGIKLRAHAPRRGRATGNERVTRCGTTATACTLESTAATSSR